MLTNSKSNVIKNVPNNHIGNIFEDFLNNIFSHDEFVVELSSSKNQLTITIKEIVKEPEKGDQEREELIHPDEIIRVLERVAADSNFASNILYHRADSLSDYNLNYAESLAICTGDIKWIETSIEKIHTKIIRKIKGVRIL